MSAITEPLKGTVEHGAAHSLAFCTISIGCPPCIWLCRTYGCINFLTIPISVLPFANSTEILQSCYDNAQGMLCRPAFTHRIKAVPFTQGMRMNRKVLFLSMFLFFLFIGLGNRAMAEVAMVSSQVPGYYRTTLGQFEITALYDGAIELDTAILHNTSPEELATFLSRAFVGNPKMQTAVNAYLINTGKNLVLVDAGAGVLFGPTLGFVVQNLVASGYDPAQVDTVIITHLHGDHMGGLNNAQGGPLFPNATVFVAKADNDFWLSQEIADDAAPEVQPFFKMARDTAAPLIAAGKWKTFGEGDPLVSGLTAVKANGHTPGHTAYELESEGRKMLIWGDLVHAHAIQFARPGVSVEFDIDQQQAIETRKRIMAETSTSKIRVAGMHLPFPGIGHVRAEGDGSYSWVPIEFSPMPGQ